MPTQCAAGACRNTMPIHALWSCRHRAVPHPGCQKCSAPANLSVLIDPAPPTAGLASRDNRLRSGTPESRRAVSTARRDLQGSPRSKLPPAVGVSPHFAPQESSGVVDVREMLRISSPPARDRWSESEGVMRVRLTALPRRLKPRTLRFVVPLNAQSR